MTSPQRRGHVDVDIDDIDAGLRRAVRPAGVPVAVQHRRVHDVLQREAAPFAAWRQRRIGLAAELEHQRLLDPVLEAEDVRRDLAPLALVAADDELALEDRAAEERVGGAWHAAGYYIFTVTLRFSPRFGGSP